MKEQRGWLNLTAPLPKDPNVDTAELQQMGQRIFALWRSLLNRITSGDPLTCLFAAVQAVVPNRSQPIWQDRKGLLARPADPAPYPDMFVPVIVPVGASVRGQ